MKRIHAISLVLVLIFALMGCSNPAADPAPEQNPDPQEVVGQTPPEEPADPGTEPNESSVEQIEVGAESEEPGLEAPEQGTEPVSPSGYSQSRSASEMTEEEFKELVNYRMEIAKLFQGSSPFECNESGLPARRFKLPSHPESHTQVVTEFLRFQRTFMSNGVPYMSAVMANTCEAQRGLEDYLLTLTAKWVASGSEPNYHMDDVKIIHSESSGNLAEVVAEAEWVTVDPDLGSFRFETQQRFELFRDGEKWFITDIQYLIDEVTMLEPPKMAEGD